MFIVVHWRSIEFADRHWTSTLRCGERRRTPVDTTERCFTCPRGSSDIGDGHRTPVDAAQGGRLTAVSSGEHWWTLVDIGLPPRGRITRCRSRRYSAILSLHSSTFTPSSTQSPLPRDVFTHRKGVHTHQENIVGSAFSHDEKCIPRLIQTSLSWSLQKPYHLRTFADTCRRAHGLLLLPHITVLCFCY